MFEINTSTGAITMHAGDTGAFQSHGARSSGTAWTSNDRMIFTVANQSGVVVLQRYYRLDTSLGSGYAEVQFHNDDTDDWAPGTYVTERRYVVNPIWEGTPTTGDVVDALNSDSHIVDGHIVRVPNNGQSTLQILRVYGEV